jgi:hypothetical protein
MDEAMAGHPAQLAESTTLTRWHCAVSTSMSMR